MSTRASAIGSFVFERSKRGSVRRFLIALAVVATLLLYVGGKVQIMQLGYQLEALELEKRELEHENRSLLIEASSLSSPARIEKIATRRLGMVRPSKENTVIVRRKSDAGKSKKQ